MAIQTMTSMRRLKACGVFCVRALIPKSLPQFLLMRHADRWDIPKGHIEDNETEIECAFRELFEETGIRNDQIRIHPDFRFENTYYPRLEYLDGETVEKTVVVFLGTVIAPVEICVTEHLGYQWFTWNDPPTETDTTVSGLIRASEEIYHSEAGNR